MARFDIDAVRAFELLKRVSQETDARLTDIAVALTTGGRFDELTV